LQFEGAGGLKKLYAAVYFLMMLSVAVTAIFLTLMPDTVPMHYNIKGEIDRYGSKYENLIMPVSMILLGVLFLLLARHFQKRQQLENQRVVLASGSVLLGFLNVLFAYFLQNSASFAPNLTDTTTDSIIFQITTIGLGFMLMILGYLMPQTSLNGIVGLRTVWSMKNERVWQKSQKAGGIIMSACGAASMLLGAFLQGISSLIGAVVLLLVGTIFAVAVSYQIFLKDQK